MEKFDAYLAGWKARLLSTGGRLVLVNAVLSNLATYYMSSTLVPKTVLDALEARRRSFLWTGEEKCHGSRCLLAWEKLCQLREYMEDWEFVPWRTKTTASSLSLFKSFMSPATFHGRHGSQANIQTDLGT